MSLTLSPGETLINFKLRTKLSSIQSKINKLIKEIDGQLSLKQFENIMFKPRCYCSYFQVTRSLKLLRKANKIDELIRQREKLDRLLYIHQRSSPVMQEFFK